MVFTGDDQEGGFLLPPGTTVIVGGGDDSDDGPGKYSTSDSYSYYTVRDFLQETFDGMGATTAGALVNDHALTFRNVNGRWPEPWEMMQYQPFLAAAVRYPTGADLLPGYFTIQGVPYVNRPDTGPVPIGADAGNVDMGIIRGLMSGARSTSSIPSLSLEQVQAIMSMRAPTVRGGGRGGGGGGFRAPVFDRATIEDSVRNMWRFLLKEEPGDVLGGLVNDYVKEATSFSRQGGSLGLEAGIRGRVRDTGRYETLYTDKPDHVDEDQWLAGFETPARQFGLRESSVLREVERGASQGIGSAGFQQQLSRLPEVRAQGGFSRSLASTVGELGVLGRT